MSDGANEERRSSTPNAGIFDVASDPNVHRHESGSFECKICLTVHANANSYLTHAQGKRHQQNLKQRESDSATIPKQEVPLKQFDKIGLPQYDIIKVRDPQTLAVGVRVEIQYPQIRDSVEPKFRMMSAFEQQVEEVDTKHQYLVIAAEPYETVALRIPARPVDDSKLWSYFNNDTKIYSLQFLFFP